MSTTRVMYIGAKGREVDNKKARTGIVWECHGDIKDVPDWAWKILSQYPDVWVDVPAEPGAVVDAGLSAVLPPPAVKQEVDDADLVAQTVSIKPPEQSPAAQLDAMNTAQLRDYALAKGYAVDLSQKAKDLRPAIRAIEEAKA